MVKKLVFMAIGALVLSGCGDTVTESINSIASGDVTAEDIKKENKILIINEVSLVSCVVLKDKLVNNDEFTDAKTLVTELGVNCTTYGKTAGEKGSECVEQNIATWLQEGDNGKDIKLDDVSGDKACVIGGDATIN